MSVKVGNPDVKIDDSVIEKILIEQVTPCVQEKLQEQYEEKVIINDITIIKN